MKLIFLIGKPQSKNHEQDRSQWNVNDTCIIAHQDRWEKKYLDQNLNKVWLEECPKIF